MSKKRNFKKTFIYSNKYIYKKYNNINIIGKKKKKKIVIQKKKRK